MIELTSPEEILKLSDYKKSDEILSGKYKDNIIIKHRHLIDRDEFYYLYKCENGEYVQKGFAANLTALKEENKDFLDACFKDEEKMFETYIDTKIGEINNDIVGM